MFLDIFIILFILLCTFLGYKKGLVKTAIGILSFFIAIIVSVLLYKTVGNLIINNTEFDENLESTISSKITIESLNEKYDLLPNNLIEEGENNIQGLSKSLSHKIIYIASFVILFIALKIGLIFAKFLSDIITKIPIIKQFDKIRGNNLGIRKRRFNSNCFFRNNTTCFSHD